MSTGQPEPSRKRLYPRRRTGTRATGANTSGSPSASGPAVSEPTDPRVERRRAIGDKLLEAMRALAQQRRRRIDWERENPAIIAAQEFLDEAVTKYVEGTATAEEVKAVYKDWVGLLEV